MMSLVGKGGSETSTRLASSTIRGTHSTPGNIDLSPEHAEAKSILFFWLTCPL